MTNQQVLAGELPFIEQSDFQKHPRRFLNKKLIAKLVFFIPLLLTILSLWFAIDEIKNWMGFSALGVWFILLLLSVFIAYKGYFVRGYVLRELDITYRKGWVFHHQITVPFNRIQHTEINHGPIDRVFKLCELEIFTAGGSKSDLSISGLDPQDAARLKEYIADKSAKYA
ncbi:MAG: PH domain-containing protein [Nonlabens sp.]